MIELSLVVPAYNEAGRLGAFLLDADGYLGRACGGGYELIVVDDGSDDGTGAVAKGAVPAVRVIRHERNRGKGAAVRTGMLAAAGRLRLFADADGATPICEERRLRAAMAAGADVAIGSRAVPGGGRRVWLWRQWETEKVSGTFSRKDPNGPWQKRFLTPFPCWQVWPHRHYLGRLFAVTVSRLLGLGIYDTQCGFKMFRAEVAEDLFRRSTLDGFAFDVELLMLAVRAGYRVAEVPVSWHDVPGSKVRLLRDGLAMLLAVWQLRYSAQSAS